MLFLNQLGVPEIIMIVGLALLLFGPKKLPEIGRSLGKGIREFKKGTSGLMDSLNDEVSKPSTQTPTTHAPQQQASLPQQGPPPAQVPPRDQEEEEIVIDLEQKKGSA